MGLVLRILLEKKHRLEHATYQILALWRPLRVLIFAHTMEPGFSISCKLSNILRSREAV